MNVLNTFHLAFVCFIAAFLYERTSKLDHKRLSNIAGYFSSSVWCRGDNPSDRFCRFKNLCYNRDVEEYVYFHGPDSIISGISPTLFEFDNGSVQNYEPLAMITSVFDMNTMSFDVTSLPTAVQTQLSFAFLDGKSYIYNRFKPDNLMHIFHDDLLPIFATFQEIGHFKSHDVRLAFFDHHNMSSDQYTDFLYRFFTETIITKVDLKDGVIYCMEEAYVGVNRDTVWYDYGFFEPQKPLLDKKKVSKKTIQTFKSYFMNKLSLESLSCHNSGNYIVLLLRRRTRLILNSNDMIEKLNEDTGWSVKVLIEDDFNPTNFAHVIKSIYCCSMLIGMHSAALVLSLFLQPSAILLELFPYAVNPENYTPYKTLAQINHITYSSWVNKFQKYSTGHPNRPAEQGGLLHLGDEERAAIMAAETVQPHLCCKDAAWLFRIYQDTYVDTESFSATVKEVIFRTKYEPIPSALQLQPGPVRNVRCNRMEGGYNLSWEQPWNLEYLEKKSYKYNIWIQNLINDDKRAVLTHNNYLVIKESDFSQLNCWVNVFGSSTKMKWAKCS